MTMMTMMMMMHLKNASSWNRYSLYILMRFTKQREREEKQIYTDRVRDIKVREDFMRWAWLSLLQSEWLIHHPSHACTGGTRRKMGKY